MAYRAEHAVVFDSGMIVGAEITPADTPDTQSLEESLHKAQSHLEAAVSATEIRDVAADKGYHAPNTLNELDEHTNYRTYIPEPKLLGGRNWSKVTRKERKTVQANRRIKKGNKGRNLQRLESEKVERTFALVLKTGGGRRCRLRGTENIQKRYCLMTVGYNLGGAKRMLFGIGTSMGLQGMMRAILAFIEDFRALSEQLPLRWGQFQPKAPASPNPFWLPATRNPKSPVSHPAPDIFNRLLGWNARLDGHILY
ncbi:transposase [Pirellula sp. SH-Sr6A]|uniref:transposase n=1 Tax=Pirellula sp. SH-Sr6A TaxID=1632865 RepID=UPI00143B1908|nr:transposase [Pirellula sp. SH-Sr6A]